MTEQIYNFAVFTDSLHRVIQASRLYGVYRACLLTTRDRSYALSILQAAEERRCGNPRGLSAVSPGRPGGFPHAHAPIHHALYPGR